MKGSQKEIVLYLAAMTLILLFGAANLKGTKELWGFNFLKFFPPFWTYLSLSVAAALMIPSASRAIMSALGGLSRIIAQKRSNVVLVYLGLVAASLALFMKFHSAIPLLGDGSLRANEIHDGNMWQPTEMLDYLLHALLYKFVFHPLGYKVTVCYRVFSAICGVVFIYGVLRLAIHIKSSEFIPLFLLMFSSGMTALFFGYVESYSLVAALLPFVILSGLKVVNGQSRRLTLILWYFVACLVHSVAVFILSLSVVMAMVLAGDETLTKARRTRKLLAVLVVVGIVGAYAGRFVGIPQINRYLLALLAQANSQQAIVTVNHGLNIMNWIFLSALPFPFLLAATAKMKRKDNVSVEKRVAFGTWLIVPSLLFVFFFVPQIGGPRDWDLFSLPTFVLVPSILIVYFARPQRTLPNQILPLIFLSCCVTAGFVAVNSAVAKSVDRFVEVIEVSKVKNLYVEYGTLFSHSANHPELFGRRWEFATKAWEQPPYKKADSLYMATQLAQHFLDIGDESRALQFIKLTLDIDSLDINNYMLLYRYYQEYGAKEDVVLLAEETERLFPNSARGQMEAGVMFLKLGYTNRGGENLKRAYQLDNTDFMVLLNYGNYQLLTGNYKQSVGLLTRAVEVKPNDFSANLGLATAYFYFGDTARAKASLAAAESLKKTLGDQQKIGRLKQLLEGTK